MVGTPIKRCAVNAVIKKFGVGSLLQDLVGDNDGYEAI